MIGIDEIFHSVLMTGTHIWNSACVTQRLCTGYAGENPGRRTPTVWSGYVGPSSHHAWHGQGKA